MRLGQKGEGTGNSLVGMVPFSTTGQDKISGRCCCQFKGRDLIQQPLPPWQVRCNGQRSCFKVRCQILDQQRLGTGDVVALAVDGRACGHRDAIVADPGEAQG